MAKSKLEEELAWQLKQAKIPFLREVKVIPGRRFSWDFQVKDLLIEVQGGTWGRGAHSTGVGISRDCVKLNLAVLAGFSQMNFTGDMIKDGTALLSIQSYLKRK